MEYFLYYSAITLCSVTLDKLTDSDKLKLTNKILAAGGSGYLVMRLVLDTINKTNGVFGF